MHLKCPQHTQWSLHWWLQNERESGGSSGHQLPFLEWRENLPPTLQKTARQHHHLCSWGYSHQSGTELLPTHGPSPSWCSSLLWLNVLFVGNWGWRHRQPFYLPYHEPALVIEWQGHTCSFLLGTKSLWHWRKWKSGPTSKRDPRPRYRPTGKCPLYRYETTGQLLHSEVGSNQVGCSCTWQKSLYCETNTGAPEEVPAPNQSWRGCNHLTSNWPYQGHQIPYLVPRTANWLSPLWSNTDHWPYAAGVCIVTGVLWWILHNHLTSKDPTYLTRNIRGQILITGDFNGHSYLWGSRDVDTRGEVIERVTDKHNLCILNDGTHTYLKPQAQHVNKPTSAIDHNFHTRTCSEKCVGGAAGYPWQWPLSHTNFDPTISGRDTTKLWSFPMGFFSKANWEQFHDGCLERITEDILEEADPLHSVEYITKAANDCIPRATTIPKKSNPWFDEECREALKARWALDKRVRQSRELRGETISAFRRSQAKALRLFNQKKRQSWAECVSKLSAETPIKHVWDREGNIWQKYLPYQTISKWKEWYCHHQPKRYC